MRTFGGHSYLRMLQVSISHLIPTGLAYNIYRGTHLRLFYLEGTSQFRHAAKIRGTFSPLHSIPRLPVLILIFFLRTDMFGFGTATRALSPLPSNSVRFAKNVIKSSTARKHRSQEKRKDHFLYGDFFIHLPRPLAELDRSKKSAANDVS